MPIFCIQKALEKGLLLAGLALLLARGQAAAGTATVAGAPAKAAGDQRKPAQKPALPGGVAKAGERPVSKMASPVVRTARPKLEAFQAEPQVRSRAGAAPVKTEAGGPQWIRVCCERDDYFPLARLVGWNTPALKQVVEMRMALDAGFPRRPPKLPRIVVELPKLGGGGPSAPAPDPMAPKGPDSEAAIEFFSEPATRSGVDVGMETVVVPIFRVAQPPPIPPVQSRANLRQE